MVSNFAEDLAFKTVIAPVIQLSAHHCIHANFSVQLGDGSARVIDFAVISPASRIAIEIDGYSYHAEGTIDRAKFDDHLDRQNELILQGWHVIRFSFDQIRRDPERCQDKLRRLLVGDAHLHRNFSPDGLVPSTIQTEALLALESSRTSGFHRGLVALPTGTGKTILSALDAKRVPGRVLFIVHNNEILKQAASAYRRVFPGASIGFINSEAESRGSSEDIIFANIASLKSARALEQFGPTDFSYVVVDEFHHGAAPSYAPVLTHFQPKFLLGLTATPDRTDRKSIVDLLEGNVVYSISTNEAISRGFLVPFTYYGLHDNVDYSAIRHNGYRYDISDLEKSLLIPRRDEAVISKYRELAGNLKTIGFCISIKHADRMSAAFSAAGIPSVSVHSQLSADERARRISAYEQGTATCIFVRDLFNEGVDFPTTQALLFLRPTESKIVFQQQLGRGLRLSPEKQNVHVLDFIGNYMGVSQVPALLRHVATGTFDGERQAKPELVYDNGCRIVFTEKAIEHLNVPDFKVFHIADLVGRVFRVYEREGRSLSPLDLFIELGDQLGHAIRNLGSYRLLVERMNSIDQSEIVLDPDFVDFDPSEAMQGSESRSLLDSKAEEVFCRFEELLDAIARGSTPRLPRMMQKRQVQAIHSLAGDVLDVLAELCLLKNAIAVYAGECGSLPHIQAPPASGGAHDIFRYIGETSAHRNSFAITNFLRTEHARIMLMFVGCLESGTGRQLLLLHELLSRKSVQWLMDLHEITSSDSFT